MSKHTPGPWKMGPIEERELPGKLIERSIPVYIYDPRNTHPEWAGGHRHPVIAQVWWHPDTSVADARLISAAPEMLEALKHVMSPGAGVEMNMDVDARSMILAAIAKAEGVES